MRRRCQPHCSPNSIQARLCQFVGAHDDMELRARDEGQGERFGYGKANGEGGVQRTGVARQGASWRSLLVAQHLHRLDAGRAAGRNVACHEGGA